MEFKLIQSSHPSTLKRFSQLNVEAIFTQKHFPLHALTRKWRCQIQGMSSNGQKSTKEDSVHVAKEGETLTSISKLYGVTMSEIAAANKNMVDVHLAFAGQLLIIPLSLQMKKGEPTKVTEPSETSLSGRDPSLGLYSRCLNPKISNVLSLHRFSYAKTTGYFLVLVPLIAFCIRCVMGALHNSVAGDLKRNVTENEDHHPGSERMRWKSALQELRDPDAMNLSPDHDHLTEDQDEVKQKEPSHNYAKLERDYAKFLSECGISNWGYWRGGSPQ